MKIPIELTDDRIRNLLITAWEAPNYTRSFNIERVERGDGSHRSRDWPSYAAAPLEADGAVVCRDRYGDYKNTFRLDRKAISIGLETMARIAPKHFMDVVTENDDVITGDVFLQCCLLGEIEYG